MGRTNRRDFIKLTSLGAAAASLPGAQTLAATSRGAPRDTSANTGKATMAENAKRTIQPLREGWRIKQLEPEKWELAALLKSAAQGGDDWLPATMPAQVHDILLERAAIDDPRVGKNAAKCTWIGEKDWAYACKFASPAGAGPAFLRFGGLDTLAVAYVNGQEIGRFDNMYRRHAVDVRRFLNAPQAANDLLIVFSSPQRFLKQVPQRFKQVKGIDAAKYFRKCHCDFGSYLGARPNHLKVGVFRDVLLDAPDRAWLEDVWVRPTLNDDLSQATIDVSVDARGATGTLKWALLDPAGQEVARGSSPTAAGKFSAELNRPQLWWPRTHGARPLYALQLELAIGGETRDARTIRFGVRRIKPILEEPETKEKRFAFEVNGQRIFLRGACWAPVEGMTHCWPAERARRLLELAEHGRMNVFRVWGEGTIPPREFYDECDQRGILIWQDFMFGYGMHPDGPPEFDENRRLEIEDLLRRVRNHPCLLLWCGGNENHMGWNFRYGGAKQEGGGLFDKVMPEAVARLDPDRLFHPSSPYGGRAPNWPLEGDWHDYSTLKFCPEASVPLYASEVGRASAPSVSSMRRFMSEEELWPKDYDPRIVTPGKPAWPPMWQYRSVGGSWDKVGPIEEFCDPRSAEDLVRVLGTAHGEYLQRRVERERRGVPDGAPDGNRRCWGNTIWRLNDGWPIVYWAAIDYYLEPKIAYYFLRRAYDPVLVCFERTADRIAVWVVNDSPREAAGQLTLQHLNFDGAKRGELSAAVRVAPGESKRCLDATDFGPVNLRGEFLLARFGEREATQLLMGERYLHLPQAQLEARLVDGKLAVATDDFARQVTLEISGVTGAVFEDNFFDLPPGAKRTIDIIDAAAGKEITIRAVNAKAVRLKLQQG